MQARGVFWELPNELMIAVMACLADNEDRQNMRLICKHWRTAVDESITGLSGNMYWTCNKHIHDVFRFPSVVRIDLSLCAAVTDLSPLASLRALRSLDLNWCRGLQPASLAALSCLTRLTHLDLSGCPDAVTDDGLPLIAGLSGRLEWLNLKGCNELNTRGLVALATFQRLRYLDCSATGVVGLAPLSKCTSLNRLRLSGCERLADGALRGLEGLPNLADLDLSGNSSLVTPVLLDDLLTLPGLRKLDLEACDDVDEAVLRSLVRLTNLRSLNLVDCRLLSQAGLAFITSRMRPRCKVYHGYW